jgi:hypothetical protein
VGLVVQPELLNPARTGSSGSAGGSGRIRRGISIATGSLKTLVRDRHLFWFSVLAGFLIIFLLAAEMWIVADNGRSLPYLVSLPFWDLYVDMRLFLLLAICFSGLSLIMAGLIRYQSRSAGGKPCTIREAFSTVSPHSHSLAGLSLLLALAGTILDAVVTQTPFFGEITFTISMAVFYLPYAYYFPDVLNSVLFFSAIIMAITILLFLLCLYVIPGIVLDKKGLLSAIAGSADLMKKTWLELLGCVLVFGAVILMVVAIALVIGQSPLLLNHDYDFFLQVSRGQVLMTVVCYGFILACGVLTAVGSTVLGVAIADLYTCGTDGEIPAERPADSAAAEPAL